MCPEKFGHLICSFKLDKKTKIVKKKIVSKTLLPIDYIRQIT